MNLIDLIEVKHLKGEQREIAEAIGIEAYRKLVAYYGGAQLYVSKLSRIVASNKKSLIKAAIGRVPDRDIIDFFCISRKAFEELKNSVK